MPEEYSRSRAYYQANRERLAAAAKERQRLWRQTPEYQEYLERTKEKRRDYKRRKRAEAGVLPRGTQEEIQLRAAIKRAGKFPSVMALVTEQQRTHWRDYPQDQKICMNPWKVQSQQFARLTSHSYRLYDRQKSKFYKARARGNHCVMISGQQLLERWAAFEYRCAYCGKRDHPKAELEIEHVIPISQGGPHDLSNIVPACTDCNTNKRTHDALIWYQAQVFYRPVRWQRILQVLANG